MAAMNFKPILSWMIIYYSCDKYMKVDMCQKYQYGNLMSNMAISYVPKIPIRQFHDQFDNLIWAEKNNAAIWWASCKFDLCQKYNTAIWWPINAIECVLKIPIR